MEHDLTEVIDHKRVQAEDYNLSVHAYVQPAEPEQEPDDGAEVFEKIRRLLAFKEEGTAQFRAYSEGRIRQLRFYRNEVLRFRELSGLAQDPTNHRTV
ncbi:hypothetical protein [Corynebacterium belfantii]|uniref:Uncharacterized protein n=1 Tax=Corynebacterium belfantii TaxID=2014537 RepID=A0ABS0LCF7_9CORY|nr:hypothetical protein [Corynebacterium belfantii]MBG9354346.1 hypothetical protein [Corynebacterium belfantii]